MLRALAARVGVLAACAGVAACRTIDPTQIVLEVDTDLGHDAATGPVEVDAIEVRVLSAVEGPPEPRTDGAVTPVDAGAPGAPPCPVVGDVEERSGRRYRVSFCGRYALPSDELRAMPLRLGVLPAGGAGSFVRFEAIAYLRDEEVVRDFQTARFERHRITYVNLSLESACRAVVCPEGQACDDGRCVDVAVPDAPDAGPPDACGGTDAEHTVCGTDARCCGGECVSIRTDPRHCGGCGLACSDGFACSASDAGLPACECSGPHAQCAPSTGSCSLESDLCSCDPMFGGSCPPGMTCRAVPGGADFCVYP
jgi:hypothetical protein